MEQPSRELAAVLEHSLEDWQQQLVKVRERIDRKQAEIDELREVERRIKRVLTAAQAPKSGPPKGLKKSPGGMKVAPLKLDQLYQAIQRDYPDQPFGSADLDGVAELGKSTLSAALKTLRDQGRIRLSHKGGVRGVTNYYRLVKPADADA